MSEIKKHIIAQARRLEFGRVHHCRSAQTLYERADASDDCTAVALGRLCMENGQLNLMKRRNDTLARLRHAAVTSEPSFLRKFAIYITYLNGGWTHESINLIYLASQKNDYQAGYILAALLERSGDVIMEYLSLPTAGRQPLYLDCLQRSARLGCLGASCVLGCYYWELGLVEEALHILTQAAESGYFDAFQLLASRCRSIGSDAYYVDMEAFLSHAKRLACDMNDFVTAGCLADYLADAERGALVDRVAALRFHRKSLDSVRHTYVVFGDRCWERSDRRLARWLRFLRDDYWLSFEQSHFPIVQISNRQHGD